MVQGMTAPVTYAAPPAMTYAAPPGVQMVKTYSAPPGAAVFQEQQMVVMEQPQMVYAVSPQQQQQVVMVPQQQQVVMAPQQQQVVMAPQQQLAIMPGQRANPNNLFQNGQIVAEGPVSREELMDARPQRLFEGMPEKAPVIFPGQMIHLQFFYQPQMVEEVFMEQPEGVMANPPGTEFAAAPSETTYEAPPGTMFSGPPGTELQEPMAAVRVVEEPEVIYTMGDGSTVEVEVEPDMMEPIHGPRPGTVVFMQPDEQQGHVIAPQQRKQGTITNALFDMLDSNADGKISRSEFRRGLKGEVIQVGQNLELPQR